MEILKEKLKRLQSLMIEYSSVNISRDDLKLEVERKRIANEILQNQNNQYQNQIIKAKKAKRNFSLYTGLYYISNIIFVIINLINGFFLNHILYTIGSFTGLLLIYLYAVYDDAKILSKNDIKFYKRMIKNNMCQYNENNQIIKELDNDLKCLISRSYNLNIEMQQICDYISNNYCHGLDINKVNTLSENVEISESKTLTKKY